MKKLAIALGLTSVCAFGQSVSGDIQIEKERLLKTSFFSEDGEEDDSVSILPIMVNITQFMNDNRLDLENLSIKEINTAVLRAKTPDLDEKENLDKLKNKQVVMTAEGNFLSFDRKMVFLKGKNATYTAIHFMDLKVGAAVKLGDEFYAQLEVYGSAPGIFFEDSNSESFGISEAEMEGYKENVGCGNCAAMGEEPDTSNSYDRFKYGAEIRVKYKRFGLSLYNNNFYTKSVGELYMEPTNGSAKPNETQFKKRSTVREFGVQLDTRILQISDRAQLSAVIGYSIGVHSVTHVRRDFAWTPHDYMRDTIEMTNKEKPQFEEDPNYGNLGRLNFGLKLKF